MSRVCWDAACKAVTAYFSSKQLLLALHHSSDIGSASQSAPFINHSSELTSNLISAALVSLTIPSNNTAQYFFTTMRFYSLHIFSINKAYACKETIIHIFQTLILLL